MLNIAPHHPARLICLRVDRSRHRAALGKKLCKAGSLPPSIARVVCVIGVRTAQFGFVPPIILCIASTQANLVNWRPKKQSE